MLAKIMLLRVFKLAVAALLVLVLLGFALNQYSAYRRSSWKNAALARLSQYTNNPGWISNQLRALKEAGPEDQATEGGWYTKNFVLMKNGEWIAYTNICRKEDWRINDLLLGYGSDHQWYYSTYHVCIGAIVFRMHGQSDSLAAMIKDYHLQPFDEKSDKCLERTWP